MPKLLSLNKNLTLFLKLINQTKRIEKSLNFEVVNKKQTIKR